MGEIDKLFEKYYAGETSLEEEKAISYHLQNIEISDFEAEHSLNEAADENRELTLGDDFDAKLFKKLEESGSEKKSMKLWPFISGIAASILLIVAYLSFESGEMITIATSNGTSLVELTDGSVITLNKNSELQYPKEFNANDRTVFLSGEAFFDIAPDPNKPFIIKSGNSITEVLGTTFNIRNYNDEANIEISVISGKVSFSSEANNESIRLLKDDKAMMSKTDNKINKIFEINQNAISWKSKKLSFDNQRMKHVIIDLERFFNISIEVKNKELLECHFKGTFHNAEMTEILSILEYSIDISYEKNGDNYVLSGKGCNTEAIDK